MLEQAGSGISGQVGHLLYSPSPVGKVSLLTGLLWLKEGVMELMWICLSHSLPSFFLISVLHPDAVSPYLDSLVLVKVFHVQTVIQSDGSGGRQSVKMPMPLFCWLAQYTLESDLLVRWLGFLICIHKWDQSVFSFFSVVCVDFWHQSYAFSLKELEKFLIISLL